MPPMVCRPKFADYNFYLICCQQLERFVQTEAACFLGLCNGPCVEGSRLFRFRDSDDFLFWSILIFYSNILINIPMDDFEFSSYSLYRFKEIIFQSFVDFARIFDFSAQPLFLQIIYSYFLP